MRIWVSFVVCVDLFVMLPFPKNSISLDPALLYISGHLHKLSARRFGDTGSQRSEFNEDGVVFYLPWRSFFFLRTMVLYVARFLRLRHRMYYLPLLAVPSVVSVKENEILSGRNFQKKCSVSLLFVRHIIVLLPPYFKRKSLILFISVSYPWKYNIVNT